MNRFTKSVVIVSTLVAAFTQLYLATRLLYPQLFFIISIAFAAAVVVGQWQPGRGVSVVLAASYVAPAAYVIWAGFENYPFEIIWALPLLGLIVSGREAWRWHLPSQWCWPLVAWALVVAVSWPLVFLREVDFDPRILPFPGVANTSIGITPWDAVTGVAYWTLVHNIGLLWFDRLFGWYGGGTQGESAARLPAFRRSVLTPLAVAGTIACGVAAYQAFVDIRFLNPHLWPHMQRASGTLGDANLLGILAALWGLAAVAFAQQWRAPWSTVGGVGGVTVAMIGVLTSGSRSALIAICLGLAILGLEGVMAWRRADPSLRPPLRRLLPIGGGALVIAAVALMILGGSAITSVVGRGSLNYIPGFGLPFGQIAYDLLWDRYTYGPAAVLMITEHPLAGVGVGAFHTLVPDFGMAASGIPIVPDNAQSWYRHHLAELGLIGSLPWIAWCGLLTYALFSRTHGTGDRFSIGVLRGALVAFGVISLLGVPGQSLPVALTFWTLVFWFASLKGIVPAPPAVWPPVTWGVTLALVAVHATITLAAARGELLPRNRSMRFGWDYRYGISNPEVSPDGSPGRRWTELRSLTVVPVKGKVLKFVAWVDHPDADERPVHTRVWADQRLVYDDGLKRSAAIFLDLQPAPGQTHIIIETEISRMWSPTEFGRSDRRILGLSVRDWTWE